jgi:hypothetical protein
MTETVAATSTNFIRNLIDQDLADGKHQAVITRFPPEPNGYLHIGHAKSICLNFGLAAHYGGRCHLRFDDTNPVKEEQEYIDAIKRDVRWLGFDWGAHEYYASDYFETLYGYAERLVEKGLAYVCDLNAEEIRAYRGTLTEPGRESPYRARSIAENLDLLRRMRAGEFADGTRVLRAKIDMASPTSTCAIRCSTASCMPATIGPAMPGVSTRCTTSPMASPIPSRGSPTRSVPSSSRPIAHSTTGCAPPWRSITRSRSNSPAST